MKRVTKKRLKIDGGNKIYLKKLEVEIAIEVSQKFRVFA